MGNIINSLYNQCKFYVCCNSKKPRIQLNDNNNNTYNSSRNNTVNKSLRAPYRKLSDNQRCNCDYHQSYKNITTTQIRKPSTSPWEKRSEQQNTQSISKSNEVIQKSKNTTEYSLQLKPLESEHDITAKTQIIKLNAKEQKSMDEETNKVSTNNVSKSSNDLDSIALTQSVINSKVKITIPPPSPTFESQILSESTVTKYEPTVL